MKSRNKIIDIIKAFGIILVLIGHACVYDSYLRKFVYIFHLPLFFLVSGYLYNDNDSKDPWGFIGKKLKKLLSMYIIYNLFFVLFHNLFFKLGILQNTGMYNLRDYVVNFLNIFLFKSNEPFAAAMWFIPVLIITLIMYNFITLFIYRKGILKSEVYRTWMIVFCALLGIYLNSRQINIGLHYQTCFIAIPFIHIGQLYKLYFKNKIKPDLFISFLIILNTLGFMFNVSGEVEFAMNKFWNPILLYTLGTGMVYVTYSISYYISIYLSRTSELLEYIGKNSFHIMSGHLLMFKLLDYGIIMLYSKNYSILSTFPIGYNKFFIIYTILSIVGCLIILKISRYIKEKFINNYTFYR